MSDKAMTANLGKGAWFLSQGAELAGLEVDKGSAGEDAGSVHMIFKKENIGALVWRYEKEKPQLSRKNVNELLVKLCKLAGGER